MDEQEVIRVAKARGLSRKGFTPRGVLNLLRGVRQQVGQVDSLNGQVIRDLEAINRDGATGGAAYKALQTAETINELVDRLNGEIQVLERQMEKLQ